MCFFFFQAEDGIRVYDVTGVQTCALPICPAVLRRAMYLLQKRTIPIPALQLFDAPSAGFGVKEVAVTATSIAAFEVDKKGKRKSLARLVQ